MIPTEEDINQGDIYWVDFDSPGGSEPGYLRPVVVIQNNALNHSRISTVIVCPLTSNPRRAGIPGNVTLNEGEGHLPRRSVVNVTQIMTVDRGSFGDRIGTLSARRVRQILNGLQRVLEPSDVDRE